MGSKRGLQAEWAVVEVGGRVIRQPKCAEQDEKRPAADKAAAVDLEGQLRGWHAVVMLSWAMLGGNSRRLATGSRESRAFDVR